MPPAPRRKAPGDDGSGKKLVQTKLNFFAKSASSSSSPSSSSTSPQNRRTNPSPGVFRRRYMREDPAEHKEFGTSDPESQRTRGTDSQETDVQSRDFSSQKSFGKWKPVNARYNQERAEIAQETISLIPGILDQFPAAQARSTLYLDENFTLAGKACPGHTLSATDPEAGRKGCRVKVIDGDTFDTAISMGRHVVVLNMANARVGGGGWKKGAMAQEEELCYRSTLSFKLHRAYYPLADLAGIYTPTVVIFRSSHATGHKLYPPNREHDRLSVISVAAIRDPPLTQNAQDYRSATDRNVMMSKIRLILRIAASEGHRKIVLGALGCGAFHNPREKVVECFLRVFRESEFSGGWWSEVVFAVLDTEDEDEDRGVKGKGNFGVFFRELNGVVV